MKIEQASIEDLKSYQCIFFDFDGVVLESGDIKTKAFMDLYAGSGIEDEVRIHHLENQGVSRYEKFKWVSENLLNEEYTIEKEKFLGDRFASLVRQQVLQAPLVRGFNKMITLLRDSQIHTVIASGTPEEELKLIVQERGFVSWFDEVHGSPKLKEDIVLEVMDRRSYAQNDCLFFGDASTDYEAAQKVGIDFYARLTLELHEYWDNVSYRYGTFDFQDI